MEIHKLHILSILQSPPLVISDLYQAPILRFAKIDQGGGSSYPFYDGEYEVIPKAFQDTTLETSGKVLTQNVHVTEIPYWETSNPTGETVYIGNEV